MSDTFSYYEVQAAIDKVRREGKKLHLDIDGASIDISPRFYSEEVGKALLWAMESAYEFVYVPGTLSLIGTSPQDLNRLLIAYRKIPKDYVKKV